MFPWGMVAGMTLTIGVDLLPGPRPEPRWRSPAAVTYSVDVAIEPGRSTSDLQPDRDLVARAAVAWAPALPMPLREATTDAADIEIHFVPPGAACFHGREVGDCRTSFDTETGTLVQAECWIDEDLDAAALRHTIAHELGHALGLKHCNGADDVMFPECGNGGVTAHDLEAMQDLYK